MYYIVGLGNPGVEYEVTRHNVGWLVLDALCQHEGFPEPIFSRKHHGRVSEGALGGESVTVFYPDTYMNHSGVAVRTLVPKSALPKLIVLHDDIALPLGEVKVSVGRGHGGHNGIKSLIAHLGTQDFARVRIGIAQKSFFTGNLKRPTGEALPRFVTGRFTKKELAVVAETVPLVEKAVSVFIRSGGDAAMNACN